MVEVGGGLVGTWLDGRLGTGFLAAGFLRGLRLGFVGAAVEAAFLGGILKVC